MSFLLMAGLYFLVDLAAILLLVATWQRTRITGFAIVAASFAAGIVARWISGGMFQALDADPALATVLVQAVFLAIAAVAVAGFWDIYRKLSARAPAPPA